MEGLMDKWQLWSARDYAAPWWPAVSAAGRSSQMVNLLTPIKVNPVSDVRWAETWSSTHMLSHICSHTFVHTNAWSHKHARAFSWMHEDARASMCARSHTHEEVEDVTEYVLIHDEFFNIFELSFLLCKRGHTRTNYVGCTLGWILLRSLRLQIAAPWRRPAV